MKALAKIPKPRYAIPILLVIATIFRIVTFRLSYLLGFDPYFHLAYIEEALKAGKWFNFFTLAFGPWGFQIKNFHPLGLWMTPAYIYKLLSPLGVSLYDAFRITPVIFGVLTVLFFYLALRRLYGDGPAFLSSLLLAMSFGHIFRSMANYYRGDNYMLFWYSVALLGIAYALTLKVKWRYSLYIIPALATGFSSAFWQAYYPIFVFVLASGLFLSIWGYLREEKYFPDATLLVLSTVLGALIANWIGGMLNYGMLGQDHGFGKAVAKKLGLTFGFVKDAYLLVHLKYLVLLALAFILALYLARRFINDFKQRAIILSIFVVMSIVILFLRFPALRELPTGFGIFTEAPIQETRPPTFHDLWAAYNVTLFLAPLFLLRLRRISWADFLVLGYVLPSLYMLSIWSRFLFIASPAIALLAGLGLLEVYGIIEPKLSGKKLVAATLVLLVVFPALSGALAFKKAWGMKPFVNEHWIRALEWLRENSNENDIVLAWWDYGHWVTYYARRAPVAQGMPNAWVAAYLLGLLDWKRAQSLGVDYVIVSYYDFLKLQSIFDTARLAKRWANLTAEGYGFAMLPMTVNLGDVMMFENEPYAVLVKPGRNAWDVSIRVGNAVGYPKELFVEKGAKVTIVPLSRFSNSGPYLYINLDYNYAFLMTEKMYNTTMARLFVRNGDERYRLVYSDGGVIKIFKLEHPNVAVERVNGTVVLRFENATGTGLGIFGFLDNGTLVFRKWYPVKGKEEFPLPLDLNGSVVIRYTYVEGRVVVDRGVFRLDMN
ncbi:STT3 domain-containing protein [Pyrococcus yayanosii]|uniref:dolichyl-phosphooligosaccharide-protein glycotransferase n=1 Tax=Pyrococcus yayanosii (strain CH1 / JCM 16557) TaxID=529709 RepID=F8AHZ2_PYRYC|nr:STT3 domain-containing protein [Pyrococcus yayanosii]AEH25449.1 Oligosaccharyl transferase, STT3 subunit [Pyrococcus yayanosii CH1]